MFPSDNTTKTKVNKCRRKKKVSATIYQCYVAQGKEQGHSDK